MKINKKPIYGFIKIDLNLINKDIREIKMALKYQLEVLKKDLISEIKIRKSENT